MQQHQQTLSSEKEALERYQQMLIWATPLSLPQRPEHTVQASEMHSQTQETYHDCFSSDTLQFLSSGLVRGGNRQNPFVLQGKDHCKVAPQRDLAGCHNSSYAALGDSVVLPGQDMGEGVTVLLHQFSLPFKPLQRTDRLKTEGFRGQTQIEGPYHDAWTMKGVHQVLLGPACQPLEGRHLVP
ncbi:MAG: hypothetical protein FRX49_10991 [Trebouxia sp. A1-2]|nr:MAG: hypothetical protein FRX49_10991 [Trebouxia sp. A1-2]